MTPKERKRRRNHRDNVRYGRKHRVVRAQFAPMVEAGVVDCTRCKERIEPGQSWDLGHDDWGGYSGPEHSSCNRTAPHRCNTSRQW